MGMVSIAFIVGLLVGTCIGFTIGANPPPDVDRHGPPKK
jgi:ABC-type nitrate/sulfonate/bicarbonate transport system permease component